MFNRAAEHLPDHPLQLIDDQRALRYLLAAYGRLEVYLTKTNENAMHTGAPITDRINVHLDSNVS
jgi:hypothetical protein